MRYQQTNPRRPLATRRRGPWRRLAALAALLCSGLAFPHGAIAATNDIFTVAGVGAPGFSGDGGVATGAELNRPVGMAETADGGLLIAHLDKPPVRRGASPGGVT